MSTIISIKAVPNSGQLSIKMDKTGIIKCYIKSSPENGKANAELVKFLAKKLKLPQEKVKIIGGVSARSKKILIDADINLNEILRLLDLEFPQLTI